MAIYQRVRDDEKLMIGMKLTFNLLKPDKAVCLKKIVQREQEELKALKGDEPPKEILKAIENTTADINIQETPPHALDLANNHILSLESALEPYNPPAVQNTNSGLDNIDLMQLVSELNDDDLVMAATQMKQNYSDNIMTKMSVLA